MREASYTGTITRRFELDVGHRLLRHESKCHNLHGHRYAFEITIRLSPGGDLDDVGRIIDFGDVKAIIGAWLDTEFDHGFLVEREDPLVPWLVASGTKHVVLDCPPTIENLVRLVYAGAVRRLAAVGLEVARVVGYETPSCWAEYP